MLQLPIARDIAEGLLFLHTNGIVHRDRKPSNILVTNQHYLKELQESQTSAEFAKHPIHCKLTDFGEGRATYLQTRTLVEHKLFEQIAKHLFLWRLRHTYVQLGPRQRKIFNEVIFGDLA